MQKRNKWGARLLAGLFLMSLGLGGCGRPAAPAAPPVESPPEPTAFSAEASRYNEKALWAFCEADREETVDTFFVGPTTVTGGLYNMTLEDAGLTEKFALQVGNQKGIYDDATRFFAPLYAQASMECFYLSEEEQKPYLDIAYADVKEAFEYYLNVYNGGRGIVLAGSSQGAGLILRLLRDYFGDETLARRLVCCYALGWKVTEETVAALPYVHFAAAADDTAAIVSFNSEAPSVGESLIVGESEKALCINPLNWSTAPEPADKSRNLGCCIYSTKGYQKGDDLPGFCGAYIDEKRGTLKVTDIDDPDGTLYPSRIEGQEYGVYHIYDWEFFYRNLEENVQTRVTAYTK